MSAEARIGDVGVVIELTLYRDNVIFDVSSATTTEIYLQNPKTKTVETKTATFTTDGTDGKIRYVTIAGDLDEQGVWLVQGHIVTPALDLTSESAKFLCERALA